MGEAAGTSRSGPSARARAVAAGLALIAAAAFGALHATTVQAAVTEYSLANASGPNALTLGPDGNIWVAESDANKLAQVTPAGVITTYPAGTAIANNPYGVVTGPDGSQPWPAFFPAYFLPLR
jgi:streptogramin lyase